MRIILFLLTFLVGYYTDLGMCWIATAVGTGLGVLSSLYGGAQASRAARKAKGELEKDSQDEKAWYERAYNLDYADTSAGQRLISKARDFARTNTKRAEGTSRVAGGTSSSEAKMKEQGNKMIGETLSSLAANDVSRKNSVDAAHQSNRRNFTTQRMNIENNRAQQITNAASQASNALINAGVAFDTMGDTKKAEDGLKEAMGKSSEAPKAQPVSTAVTPEVGKEVSDAQSFYPASPTRSFFDFMNDDYDEYNRRF